MAPQWRRNAAVLLLAGVVSTGCLLGGGDDDDASSDGDTDGSESGQPTATATAAVTEYVVQAGDTLSGIADQFGVALSLLQQANNIADANHLEVGQKLIIPSEDSPVATGTAGSAPTGTATSAAATGAAAGSSDCDRSYPDVCIPSSPPLLTCDDITPRGFRVVAPDPHNLDIDNDGFGCEDGDLPE